MILKVFNLNPKNDTIVSMKFNELKSNMGETTWLTSARGITNGDNDPQGILVYSDECE